MGARAKTYVPLLPSRESFEDTQTDSAVTQVAHDNEKSPLAGIKHLRGDDRQGYTFTAGVVQSVAHKLGRVPVGIALVHSHANTSDVTGHRVANPTGYADDKFFSFVFVNTCTLSFLVW